MIYQPTNERRCTLCHEWFPAIQLFFYPSKTGRFGLNSRCRWCARQARKDNYYRDPDKPRAYARDYHATHKEEESQKQHEVRCTDEYRSQQRERYADNPEPFRQKRREYHDRNYEKELEHHRRYNAEHREELRQIAEDRRKDYPLLVWAKQRDWWNRNPNKRRAYLANYRSKKKANEGTYSNEDVALIYDKQNGRCFWCSKPVGKSYHVDHVIPVSRGGSNWPENLVIACQRCNHSKRDKLAYTEWQPPNPLKPHD